MYTAQDFALSLIKTPSGVMMVLVMLFFVLVTLYGVVSNMLDEWNPDLWFVNPSTDQLDIMSKFQYHTWYGLVKHQLLVKDSSNTHFVDVKKCSYERLQPLDVGVFTFFRGRFTGKIYIAHYFPTNTK